MNFCCYEFVIELLRLVYVLMKYCRIVTTWCRFWSPICLCRYVSETGKRWVEQKGGWRQEERKITYEMAWNRLWWFRKKEGFKGAGVQSLEVEEEREATYFGPQPKAGATGIVEDNPIDLCDKEDDWKLFAFLCFFLYVERILLHFAWHCGTLNKIVFWIIRLKIANSNKD